MSTSTKSELAKKYTKLTGLTYNIDALIKNAKTQNDKAVLYKKLFWSIPEGSLDEVKGERQVLYAEVRAALKKILIGDAPIVDSTVILELINAALSNITLHSTDDTHSSILASIKSQLNTLKANALNAKTEAELSNIQTQFNALDTQIIEILTSEHPSEDGTDKPLMGDLSDIGSDDETYGSSAEIIEA